MTYFLRNINSIKGQILKIPLFVAFQSYQEWLYILNDNSEILWLFYKIMGIFDLYLIIKLFSLLVVGYFDKITDQLDQIRDYIQNKYLNIGVKKLKNQIKEGQVIIQLRMYLWQKVEKNSKNQRVDTDNNQEIEKKEQKQDSQQQEQQQNSKLRIQQSNENFKKQSIILEDTDEEKIKISLNIKVQDYKQVQRSEQDKNNEKQSKKIRESYKSIPIEIQNMQESDLILREEDIQNNQDDGEQLNLSFQQ